MKKIIFLLAISAITYLSAGFYFKLYSIYAVLNKLKSLDYKVIISGNLFEQFAIVAIGILTFVFLLLLMKILFRKKSKLVATKNDSKKKIIQVMVKNQGMAISNEVWYELLKIDNGQLLETDKNYLIQLTNGKKLVVDKNKIHENDESRIVYWGSMHEIGGSDFLFTKMKGHSNMHELWHSYYTPTHGGFVILCSVN